MTALLNLPGAPWSCVESFTDVVCGMASATNGCIRARAADAAAAIRGVQPFNGRPSHTRSWVVFARTETDLNGVIVDDAHEPPPSSGAPAEALFAFDDDPRVPHTRPNYYLFRRHGLAVDVPAWIAPSNKDDTQTDLRSLFGPLAFRPVPIAGDVTNPLRRSVADLVNATLDERCAFRHGGTSLGISRCHAELQLSSDPYLRETTIRISFIDPETLESHFQNGITLGADTDIDALFPQRERWLKRLSLQGDGTGMRASYLTVFSSHTREAILPDEVDQAFLRFPRGELACYLLHWLLIRVRAGKAKTFDDRWAAWSKSEGNDRLILFRKLLDATVTPVPDPSTFARSGDRAFTPRGLMPEPLSYRSALGEIGFGDDKSYEEVLHTAARFIADEFDMTGALGPRGFRELPMYRGLGWQWSDSLAVEAPNKDEEPLVLLEQIHRAFMHGDFSAARLADHVGRSVFPIGECLAQWPSHNFSEYLILPLWEDDLLGERRPVIFAHVFATAASDQTGGRLQYLLLPVAAAVANDYYAATKDRVTALQGLTRQATSQVLLMGAIAHSAGNALRLANAEFATQLLSEGDPPSRLRDWTNNEHKKNEILVAVRNLWIGARVVRFLVALVEIAAKDEPLRDKFQTTTRYTLDRCIDVADQMVQAYCTAIPNSVRVDVQRGSAIDVDLPPGFIDKVYLETLFFEVFLNVSKFGQTVERHGIVVAPVRIDIRAQGQVKVHIVNPIWDEEAAGEWIQVNGVAKPAAKVGGAYNATFLDFARGLGERLGGITVSSTRKTAKGKGFYETLITLGAMRVKDNRGFVRTVSPDAGGHTP